MPWGIQMSKSEAVEIFNEWEVLREEESDKKGM
jgi:hypothetical protein